MPTHFRDDKTPIVQFDPRVEVSPFLLFKRLKEDRAPRLIDVRPERKLRTLRGAETFEGEGWKPEDGEEIILFDEDGTIALPLVLHFHRAGFERVKMLFGGLDLYEFSLSPEVVGSDTFLDRIG